MIGYSVGKRQVSVHTTLALMSVQMTLEPVIAGAPTDSATPVRTGDIRVVLSETVREEAATRHITMERSLSVLAEDLLLIFYVLLDSFTSKFDFKHIPFLFLRRHTFEKDFLLLAFLINGHNSVNELVVLRVTWSDSAQHNIFKVPL